MDRLETIRVRVGGIGVETLVSTKRGPAVLLLHGNSASKEVFAGQFANLINAGAFVIAPDLPGHGASDDADESATVYNIPALAELVFDLLDTLEVLNVHIVGWSLGGHIALEMMRRAPARVRSVVTVGTPPIAANPDSIARAFVPSPAVMLAGKPVWSDDEAATFAVAVLGGSKPIPPEMLSAFRRADGRARALVFQHALTDPTFDQAEVVRTSALPLAIVHGERDALVRLDHLASLSFRALWSGAPIVVEDAGHAPHWEKPDQFNAILLKFLAAQDPAFAH